MPRKKTTKKKTKFGAKAKFVRSMPASMSARKVVEEAAKAGISISENHVYSVRAATKKTGKKVAKGAVKKKAAPKAAKAKGKTKTTKKRKTAPAPKPVVRTTPRTGSPEERFVDLVLDIGLARSTELLSKIKERVKQLRLV